MATPPTVRAISREGLEGAPGWFERVLQPLNTFLREVADALQGNLTPSQNLAQCWLEVQVSFGVEIPVLALPAKFRSRTPYGVTVERAVVEEGSLAGAPGLEWEAATLEGAPAIRILIAHGLNVGATARYRLLVKAE
jgi:hypothetical protein